MGTIREIIDRVNENNPNGYAEKTMIGWISQLDGKIALNVMLMNAAETAQFRYTYPEALDNEPLVPFPHDDLYDLWLNVKIHGENGETERYQNALLLYNAAYRDYVRWFASTYAPAQEESTAITYYITAYGLAVQQGYSGSLDEWLASLKGEPGDTGKSAYEYAQEAGYEGTEEQYRERMLGAGKTAYEYAVEGGYEGTADEFRIKLAKEYALAEHNHDKWYFTKTETDQKLKDFLDSDLAEEGKAAEAKATGEKFAQMLPKSGGEMTGALSVLTPTEDTHAASKAYVDSKKFDPTVNLPAASWVGSAAPYTQTVAVEGILSTDNPHYGAVYAADQETRLAQKEAFAMVDDLITANGSVTFECFEEKPGTDLTIHLEVNR